MSLSTVLPLDLSKGILGKPDEESLWEEIVSHIPDEVLLDPNALILNVACGTGTEARVLGRRMHRLGVSVAEIRRRIWALDKYLTERVRLELGLENVITADFMQWETDMKFDVIIGNPPYQGSNDKGSAQPKSHNIWSRFVSKSIDLLKSRGHLCFVTPNSWMSYNSKVMKLFKQNTLLSANTDASRYFSVGSTFTWWVLQEGKTGQSQTMIDGHTVNLASLTYMPVNFSDTFGIHKKVVFDYSGSKLPVQQDRTVHSDYKKELTQDTKDKVYKFPTHHTNAQTKYSKIKSKCFNDKKIIWTLSGYFKPFYDDGQIGITEACQYIPVKSEQEAKYILSYLTSKVFRFIIGTGKWSGFLNGRVIADLPKLSANRMWTDEELYAHFNLTQEEIDYIEQIVK